MKTLFKFVIGLVFITMCLVLVCAGCAENPVAEKYPVKTGITEQCVKQITITFKDHTQITHNYTTLEYSPLLDNDGCAFIIMNDKRYIATYQTNTIESLFCH